MSRGQNSCRNSNGASRARRDWSNLRNFRVVRLNATLFPVNDYEAALYRQYALRPIEVEANTPEAIIPHVAECDALFASSVALPAPVVEALKPWHVVSQLGAIRPKTLHGLCTNLNILVTNVPYF